MVEQCPKCKKHDGYTWHWSKGFDGSGYSECKNCKVKFK